MVCGNRIYEACAVRVYRHRTGNILFWKIQPTNIDEKPECSDVGEHELLYMLSMLYEL